MDQEHEDYADCELAPTGVVSLRQLALALLIAFVVIGAGLTWFWFALLLPGADC